MPKQSPADVRAHGALDRATRNPVPAAGLGLFRLTRHPNYLGDWILFSGLCLIAGRWFLAAIPALMLCGFVFIDIPTLDAHLSQHDGASFDRYATQTRKLIPFLY